MLEWCLLLNLPIGILTLTKKSPTLVVDLCVQNSEEEYINIEERDIQGNESSGKKILRELDNKGTVKTSGKNN